jgi:putative transposase
MPRANRHFVAGHVWHLTHRCHKKEFLLKFARDRRYWLRWLFEAKKRFGLCVLNYIVTSNHIHLLVLDRGNDAIPKSMQLVAGRTAQEYNRRKCRKGAFWEDRYHATAIDTDAHLVHCLVYIDLNMVRAGMITHPSEWQESGFREIQKPPRRYAVIDLKALIDLLGLDNLEHLQRSHRQWVDAICDSGGAGREAAWTESIAVGSRIFVEAVQRRLGPRARYRHVVDRSGTYALREPTTHYGNAACKIDALSLGNTHILDKSALK